MFTFRFSVIPEQVCVIVAVGTGTPGGPTKNGANDMMNMMVATTTHQRPYLVRIAQLNP
jgi:hypothetical protein